MKLVVLYILAMPIAAGLRRRLGPPEDGPRRPVNPGPHGLTEILYAFASAANNNGSAFGGLTATSNWYTTTLGLAMLVGRFFLIIPALAIAGSLVRKPKLPSPPARSPPTRRCSSASSLGVDPDRRRPHLLPRARARPHRRAPRRCEAPSMSSHHPQPDRAAVEHAPAEVTAPGARRPQAVRPGDHRAGRSGTASASSTPFTLIRNPVMFVVEVGSVLTTLLFFRDLGSSTAIGERVRRAGQPLAVVHGAVRQLRRGDGGGPGQGAGGDAAQDPGRDRRPRPPGRTAAWSRSRRRARSSATSASSRLAR